MNDGENNNIIDFPGNSEVKDEYNEIAEFIEKHPAESEILWRLSDSLDLACVRYEALIQAIVARENLPDDKVAVLKEFADKMLNRLVDIENCLLDEYNFLRYMLEGESVNDIESND